MQVQLLVFVAAVIFASATSAPSDQFEKTVKSTQDFQGLLKIAQDEIDGVDNFKLGQIQKYHAAVDANNASFNALTAVYQGYVDSAGLFCTVSKWDYSTTVKTTQKKLNKYNNRNVTGELDVKFTKERGQLEENPGEIQRLQQEAAQDDSPKNVKANLDKAQKLLIKAHEDFYCKMDKCMSLTIKDMDNAISQRLGAQTRKGNRIVKCAL